ncbi:hypothetical protein F4861DRAFT_550955 [Xylaria intraflava]|nr:hypothetical protein F4861DRAFT_550955 [Xylaria intraflava]
MSYSNMSSEATTMAHVRAQLDGFSKVVKLPLSLYNSLSDHEKAIVKNETGIIAGEAVDFYQDGKDGGRVYLGYLKTIQEMWPCVPQVLPNQSLPTLFGMNMPIIQPPNNPQPEPPASDSKNSKGRNAFLIFRTHYGKVLRSVYPDIPNRDVSRILGPETWSTYEKDEKEPWFIISRDERDKILNGTLIIPEKRRRGKVDENLLVIPVCLSHWSPKPAHVVVPSMITTPVQNEERFFLREQNNAAGQLQLALAGVNAQQANGGVANPLTENGSQAIDLYKYSRAPVGFNAQQANSPTVNGSQAINSSNYSQAPVALNAQQANGGVAQPLTANGSQAINSNNYSQAPADFNAQQANGEVAQPSTANGSQAINSSNYSQAPVTLNAQQANGEAAQPPIENENQDIDLYKLMNPKPVGDAQAPREAEADQGGKTQTEQPVMEDGANASDVNDNFDLEELLGNPSGNEFDDLFDFQGYSVSFNLSPQPHGRDDEAQPDQAPDPEQENKRQKLDNGGALNLYTNEEGRQHPYPPPPY